jgi:hypothetical protein
VATAENPVSMTICKSFQHASGKEPCGCTNGSLTTPAGVGAEHRQLKAYRSGQRRNQRAGVQRSAELVGCPAAILSSLGFGRGALVAYGGKIVKEPWRFDTGCGLVAPLISYAQAVPRCRGWPRIASHYEASGSEKALIN